MQNIPPVLYRGSVKNVRGEVSAKNLIFEYSDRYSLFDWGEMPDQIEGKGVALKSMGEAFFIWVEKKENWINLFEEECIKKQFDSVFLMDLKKTKTYSNLVTNGLNHHACNLNSRQLPINPFLEVKNIKVVRPKSFAGGYDYTYYLNKSVVNTLVPLEVIFRLGLPKGNSLSKRLTEKEDWISYGFDRDPGFGMLKNVIIDFSTKLENGDRPLSHEESKRIAGLSENEYQELSNLTSLLALNLYAFHFSIGLELWDGKVEFAFVLNENNERSFMLVDSIGLDELRLQMKGKSISKEFLREFYKKTEWYYSLELSKRDSLLEEGKVDFKQICLSKYSQWPCHLDVKVKNQVEDLYKSYTNEVCMKILNHAPFDKELNLKNYMEMYL
jgi:phosphoribosylaminoimidazole-succinocarboxamide synthase